MDRNNDSLSQQSNIPQQPPAPKPKNWKTVFKFLLIGNAIFVFWAATELKNANQGSANFTAMGVLVASVPVVIIDVIALLYYRNKEKPQGIQRWVSFAALVLVTLPLLYVLITYIVFEAFHFVNRIF